MVADTALAALHSAISSANARRAHSQAEAQQRRELLMAVQQRVRLLVLLKRVLGPRKWALACAQAAHTLGCATPPRATGVLSPTACLGLLAIIQLSISAARAAPPASLARSAQPPLTVYMGDLLRQGADSCVEMGYRVQHAWEDLAPAAAQHLLASDTVQRAIEVSAGLAWKQFSSCVASRVTSLLEGGAGGRTPAIKAAPKPSCFSLEALLGLGMGAALKWGLGRLTSAAQGAIIGDLPTALPPGLWPPTASGLWENRKLLLRCAAWQLTAETADAWREMHGNPGIAVLASWIASGGRRCDWGPSAPPAMQSSPTQSQHQGAHAAGVCLAEDLPQLIRALSAGFGSLFGRGQQQHSRLVRSPSDDLEIPTWTIASSRFALSDLIDNVPGYSPVDAMDVGLPARSPAPLPTGPSVPRASRMLGLAKILPRFVARAVKGLIRLRRSGRPGR